MCSIICEQPGALTEALDPQGGRSKTLDALESQICALASHLAAATCRWLLLIGEFDAREGWAEWGTTSCAHWLSWRCGIGLTAGREHVRAARVLRGLPLVQQAFASGELSYSKVRALTRVASDKTEADLLELARHATGAQLEKLCRQYGRVLQATTEHACSVYERQKLSTYWDDDGMLVVEGRLTPEDGAALMAALDQATESVPPDTADLGATAVRAQALMVLATTGGADTEIVVHVDADTVRSDVIKSQCELTAGPALAPETARRLSCDGAVVPLFERGGQPLSVGRRTRAIPPALRRALRSRDAGCRFPGCTHTKHLHAHHIQHWARGGRTEISNLVQLCSYHHQLVHEGGYRVEVRRGGSLEFRKPDGCVIESRCRAQPASGPGITRQNSAQGLRIRSGTCRPLSAGDRLDYGMAVEGLIWRELRPRDSG